MSNVELISYSDAPTAISVVAFLASLDPLSAAKPFSVVMNDIHTSVLSGQYLVYGDKMEVGGNRKQHPMFALCWVQVDQITAAAIMNNIRAPMPYEAKNGSNVILTKLICPFFETTVDNNWHPALGVGIQKMKEITEQNKFFAVDY